MSAPANTKVLPFADRVELVRQEVKQRIQTKQPVNAYAFQASCWCAWLRREVNS